MAVAEEKDRLVPAEAEAKWRARQAERSLQEAEDLHADRLRQEVRPVL